MVFWAWEQHKKAMAQIDADIAASRAKEEERRREEARALAFRLAEAEAIGQVKGEIIGQARGEAATVRRYEKWLTKVAAERGIKLAELLPPPKDTPRR